MMRKITAVFCLLWTMQLSASIGFEQGNLTIQNVTKPQLYVFCSKKQTTLLLDRIQFEQSASAGWSTTLAPFACTIFFVDTASFTFSCRQYNTGNLHTVDCSQYLLASQFPWEGALLSGGMPSGSFWVAENIAADDVPVVLRHRKFDV